MYAERRGSVVVSTYAWHAAGQGLDSRTRHVSPLSCLIDRNLILAGLRCKYTGLVVCSEVA